MKDPMRHCSLYLSPFPIFHTLAQPHYGDVVKSLPRPLPMPVLGTHSPNKEDEEVEDNDKVGT